MYNVISTGSKGNAVIYHNCILVDCGVPYSKIKPYIKDLNIVLLTHVHLDHINITTLKKMQLERPSLRIGCCEWMLSLLSELRNVDVYNIGKIYDYGLFEVCPVKLYHNVLNCGYRIFKNKTRIIHATDTAHLNGIQAKGYDLYAIEHNYDEDTIFDNIENKQKQGQFCYEKGAVNSHLSRQQANQFIFENKKESSEILMLHQSENNF